MTKETFKEARERLINSDEYKKASEIQKCCFMNSLHIRYSFLEDALLKVKDKDE